MIDSTGVGVVGICSVHADRKRTRTTQKDESSSPSKLRSGEGWCAYDQIVKTVAVYIAGPSNLASQAVVNAHNGKSIHEAEVGTGINICPSGEEPARTIMRRPDYHICDAVVVDVPGGIGRRAKRIACRLTRKGMQESKRLTGI